MTVGDKVRLVDHSYHVDLCVNGVLDSIPKIGGFHTGHKLRLVAVNCELPVLYDFKLRHAGPNNFRNDVVVFDEDEGMYFFTHHSFLTSSKCPTCGRE